jgi:hypothetical protein
MNMQDISMPVMEYCNPLAHDPALYIHPET